MNLLTIDKIIEIFCAVDEFCKKEYAQMIEEKKALPARDDKK